MTWLVIPFYVLAAALAIGSSLLDQPLGPAAAWGEVGLTGELRALLTDPDPGDEAQRLIVRLFPVAYPDDDEMEAEYQRLMREELVGSKLAALDAVDEEIGRASCRERV